MDVREDQALPWVGIALLVSAIPAGSAPIARASWDVCDLPPLLHLTTKNGEPYQIIFSVIGIAMHHDAYRIQLRYGRSDSGAIPDCWRFDSGGCQLAGEFRIDFFGPHTFTRCWVFTLGELQIFPSASMVHDEARDQMTITCEADYPPGIDETHDGQRFFLALMQFDQFYGVIGKAEAPSCGGLEQPMCFVVESVRIRSNGKWMEIPIEERVLTASGPGVTVESCEAVPARPTTWGAIKAAWR